MNKYIKLDNNALNNMTEFLKRHFSVSENDKLSCVECRSLAEKILSFLPTIEVSEEVLKATKKFNAYTIADENAEMGMRTQIEPIIEVSEDCISRAEVLDEFKKDYDDIVDLMTAIEDLPSVAPSGTIVECYARNCEKNKNGRCEATDIILEFGCGE